MDFQKVADYRNQHNIFGRRLGIFVEEVRLGYARAVKTVEADDVNPVKVAHGGIYFTMADAVSAAAISSHGYAAVTLNASCSFLRSAKVGDTLIAEATEISGGKTICVYETRVFDSAGTLYSSGTFTFYKLNQKLEL